MDHSEKRTEKRNPFVQVLRCIDIAGKVVEGISVNISNSGICLYAHKVFKAGDVLTLDAHLPITCKKTVVCWVREIDRSFSLIGVKCIN